MHKSVFVLYITVLLSGSMVNCNQENTIECIGNPQNGKCQLIPQSGPCKAHIERFYFDNQEKKCKEFIWGGCEGVVPFQTIQACELGCNCI